MLHHQDHLYFNILSKVEEESATNCRKFDPGTYVVLSDEKRGMRKTR